MVYIDRERREVVVKLAYCGPVSSGKTTNLQVIHRKTPQKARSDWSYTHGVAHINIYPFELGNPGKLNTRIQIFVLQPDGDESARKQILQNIDGIVFVADSHRERLGENLETLQQLEKDLDGCGRDIIDILKVIQWNKQDLVAACKPDQLHKCINYYDFRTVPACSTNYEGVFPTLSSCMHNLRVQIGQEVRRSIRDQRRGQTMHEIQPHTKYDNCTFYLQNKVRFNSCVFHNCSFRSDRIRIESFDSCKMVNCGFWGEYEIELSQCNLSCVPEWIFRVTFATKITISQNEITNISHLIGKFRNLTHLHLDNNLLTTLPASIKKLQNLQFMSLSGNNIDKPHRDWLISQLPNCEIHF